MKQRENPADKNDMGLGERVIQENPTRLVNRDGSFNVRRKGAGERGSFSPYHAIMNASWPRFIFGVLAYYVLANLFFTILYMACGREAFTEISGWSLSGRFSQLFYYSIQVISTLGSSPLHPSGTEASIIMAVESMVGLFGFAVGASLMFARFSNPAVKILFSEKAVMGPFEGGRALMIRVINGRSNELIDVKAVLTVALEGGPGRRRKFQQVKLERDSVLVFPLNWTVVHPIDEDSPLYNLSGGDLAKANPEFLLTITAVDQDLSRTVYARASYLFNAGEVALNAKFKNILEHQPDGTIVVDPKRISEMEKIS